MTEESETKDESPSAGSVSLGLNSTEEEILLNSGSVNFRLAFAVFVIALGSSFQFGYNIGVTNAPSDFIKIWISKSHESMFGHEPSESLNKIIFSAAVAIFTLGGMVGGLLVGYVADRLGRKRSLHLNNILSLAAGKLFVVAYLVNCYPIFHLARFIVGINAGLASGLVPMILTELSPIKLRGAFGSIPQLVVTFSILVAQIFGLPFIFGTLDKWIWMFAFLLVPSVLQIIGLFFVPESPKYTLMFCDNHDQALADLMKFRKSQEITKLELKTLEHEKVTNEDRQSLSVEQLIMSNSLRWSLLIVVLLMAFQQLSGINAVMFYSTDIFKDAGLEGVKAVYGSIGVATLNVLTTLLSVWLVDHRAFGRRQLLYIGKIGMSVTCVGLVISLALSKTDTFVEIASYFSLFFLPLFVLFFACGPGAIPFFYTNEIFSSEAQGSANSIAIASNWSFNFLVSLTFPLINAELKEYTFLIFAAICLLAAIFIIAYLPETKGKSTEEIKHDLKRRQPRCFK